MKQVSQNFKNAMKQYGKQITSIIEYTENGIEKTLSSDDLFSVTLITNGNILKSVMKQLNFDSSVKLEKDTEIKYKFGVLLSNNQYEYIDYGNYIVAEEPEYNADTLSYTHKCYDKMIYSMKDYESLNVTYPINIKTYLRALANRIGLTLKNSTFYNQNKKILNELYLTTDGDSLGYTYRDVLDEIAQATGSIICISNDDKLEVRYLNETNETINEDLLKDVNVTMKEQFGTVNLIVLSRSGGSDKIYYPETLPQNPFPITIEDNQIMNFNNRDEFLQGLYNALNGLNYYINDFTSTGICYLELGDKYNIEIDGITYNCVLLNDEIDITQGLEEQIHTDMPEQGETDYTKADKTDRKLNQTTLIVDKQNQQIQGIVSQIGDRSQKTTTITADIDGLNSRVEDIESLVDEINGITTIELENCIEGNLLELHIYGNNTVFEQLYPRNDLYPSNDLFPSRASRIIVTDENNNSIVYELGVTEVLRQNRDVRDEYILQDGVAKVIRRINQDGTIKTNETIEDLGEFYIYLAEGTNTITIQNYTAPIKAKFAIKSDYTEVFATRVEMNSSITQTAEEINLEVRKKVDENEVISKINQSAEAVGISANKINLSANDVLNLLAGNTINLSSKNIEIKADDILINNRGMSFTYNNSKVGEFITEEITGDSSKRGVSMNIDSNAYFLGLGKYDNNNESQQILAFYNRPTSSHDNAIQIGNPNWNTFVTIHEDVYVYGYLSASNLINRSLETLKKDIEKSNFNATKEVMNTDIYSYRLKEEKENQKKHFGVIIGDNYKCSDKILNEDKDGVELYSMTSILWKAFQEQQEEIEKLRKEINNG